MPSRIPTTSRLRFPSGSSASLLIWVFAALAAVGCARSATAQGLPEPRPGDPRPVRVPKVEEVVLANGLRVAVVERRASPLVTVKLSFVAGAKSEGLAQAGLADMAMGLLTKGTTSRSASQIASQIEFLGGSIEAGAGWSSADLTLSVPSYNLGKAFPVFADVATNPTFAQGEIDLLKTQILDGLNYNLRQPSFLANYAASVYSFGEHPVGGTPKSVESLSRQDIVGFREGLLGPGRAVLIFVGDISMSQARRIAETHLGRWRSAEGAARPEEGPKPLEGTYRPGAVRRILVVDLPNTGQAAVVYAKRMAFGRVAATGGSSGAPDQRYYPAQVLNSVLGGGYSSRLNQEIRIKRGLSYGAGSSFSWRAAAANFSTRVQTKNESAGEVADLTMSELSRISSEEVGPPELKARKSVLIGSFGQGMETNESVAGQLAVLYGLGLSHSELEGFVGGIGAVEAATVRRAAEEILFGGDLIVVGDHGIFGQDLAKRFPGVPVKVIKSSELNLGNLR